MKKKTFEVNNVTVNIFYDKIPDKKTLLEPCIKFLRAVEAEKQIKKDA